MIIRAKTFRRWMKTNFTKQNLKDMSRHGVAGGWSGLIYYSETTKLYQRFEDEIWTMLAEDSEETGFSIFELMSGFRGIDNIHCAAHFKNMLVWYAAERIAYELSIS